MLVKIGDYDVVLSLVCVILKYHDGYILYFTNGFKIEATGSEIENKLAPDYPTMLSLLEKTWGRTWPTTVSETLEEQKKQMQELKDFEKFPSNETKLQSDGY